MEELRIAQVGSEESLALTLSIPICREDHTSAHTSGSPHGKGRVSEAAAKRNLSLAVVGLGLLVFRCFFAGFWVGTSALRFLAPPAWFLVRFLLLSSISELLLFLFSVLSRPSETSILGFSRLLLFEDRGRDCATLAGSVAEVGVTLLGIAWIVAGGLESDVDAEIPCKRFDCLRICSEWPSLSTPVVVDRIFGEFV